MINLFGCSGTLRDGRETVDVLGCSERGGRNIYIPCVVL